MKNLLRLLWWVAYIVVALILQQQFPGVDALAPGLLISLQDRNKWQSFWLFLLFVLIQEGAGSLGFGSALLLYGGQAPLYRLAERLFVADNILFVLMLSTSLGVYRSLITWFMCIVQKVPVEYMLLVQESLFQAVSILVLWGVACLFRPRAVFHNG